MPAVGFHPRTGRHGFHAGWAVALMSFWLSLLWAVAIHPLNAPDETAYLQAVMQTRNERRLPEIFFDFTDHPAGKVVGTPGDPAALAYIRSLGYTDPIRLMPYQNVQPPLYFLVTGLLTQLVPPDPPLILYLSRAVSAAFGAGTVYFCWAATRQVAPRAPLWAVGVAGVVALLPQFCFNNARAGNDSLVNCLAAAAFYVWFRGLREPGYDPRLLGAGAVVGLAVLAKLNALLLIPGLVGVVVFRVAQGRGQSASRQAWMARAVRLAAGAGGSLALVCGWWFVRNLIVYGEPSGTQAANLFWKLNLPALPWSSPEARWEFVRSSWLSFWGYFGWQSVAMPDPFYDQALVGSGLLLGLSLLAGVGWLLRRAPARAPIATYVWQVGVLLAGSAALLVYSFVQYSLNVALSAQGRYLFPALLLPGALLFTGGLHALARGRRTAPLALGLPILWLGAWNAVGLILVR